MHTSLNSGVFNLRQYAIDCGLSTGDLLAKEEGAVSTDEEMNYIIGSIDCLVNCSQQEGLSWTPIDAMMCGTPTILSDSTAHKDFEIAGAFVDCKVPSLLPSMGQLGPTWVDSCSCKPKAIAEAMNYIINWSEEEKALWKDKSVEYSKDWIKGCGDVNALLEKISTKKKEIPIVKRDDVLFAQHSSAGDVLMTTQCFKGIKERHKGKRLVYMTQLMYSGVLRGNPYIDEILTWSDSELKKHVVVYNPHGEKILIGGWNNLDVKLYDMYPYFTKVEADKIFIAQERPAEDLIKDFINEEYIVVNTTGGSPYRIYKHMGLVIKGLPYKVVQIGAKSDLCCEGAIDLRGKLTWTESAFVMAKAIASVTIDSFCSHLSGAVDTKGVVLFGPAPARVTGPRHDKAVEMIFLQPNMLDVCQCMHHCWGNFAQGAKKCQSPCINTINPLKVKESLLHLLKGSII
jgi:ADP-heptose:LPS heptosyltransferase